MDRSNLAIIFLCVAIAVMSVWKLDWNCLIVTVIGIAIVSAPMITTGDRNTRYDMRLMGIALIPLAALTVLFVVNQSLDLEHYYPVSIAIQAGAIMAFGLMLAVFLNARTELSLSRRWVVVFALTFAVSTSVLYTLSTLYWMISTGFPLHNDDFGTTLENNVVNMMIMLPMAVMTFATLLYGIIINAYLKRVRSLQISQFITGGRT